MSQGSLTFDAEGYSADMPQLRVRFREPHLLGSPVNKWEMQVWCCGICMPPHTHCG